MSLTQSKRVLTILVSGCERIQNLACSSLATLGQEAFAIAAQRAANIEGYILNSAGIPSERIVALYGGRIHEQSATMYLVPAHVEFAAEPGVVAVPSNVRQKKATFI
jgi:hypothetical protein